MKKTIEKLGLHLTVLLHKAGADDQAYEEILESLEKARERAKDAPQESPEDPQGLIKTTRAALRWDQITSTGAQ